MKLYIQRIRSTGRFAIILKNENGKILLDADSSLRRAKEQLASLRAAWGIEEPKLTVTKRGNRK